MRRLALSLFVLGLCSCGGGGHRSRIPAGSSDDGGAAAPAASEAAAPASSDAVAEAPAPASSAAAAETPPPAEGPGAALRSSGGGSYGLAATEAAGLSRDDAAKTLNDAGPSTDKCYEKLFKKKKETSGKTTLEIKVDPKGKTKGVKVLSDDVKDKALAKCLQGAFKKSAWPKPTEKAGGKVTVEATAAGAAPAKLARAGQNSGAFLLRCPTAPPCCHAARCSRDLSRPSPSRSRSRRRRCWRRAKGAVRPRPGRRQLRLSPRR
ncbi:MAG: AgmX/PglI C-terminal domain-containing protein [Polyangiaceae bacterium]|nr:AgmX/PglI C-terminal domain-containing protein [Polyangiaceae bacterium]